MAHCQKLIFKAGASLANAHVQAERGAVHPAQGAILHGHHQVSDFFAATAQGIHDETLKQQDDQTSSVADTRAISGGRGEAGHKGSSK
jgi:hypothetical protein